MLTFDFRDFERAAKGLDAAADQIPFALAQSLNDGVAAARQEIVSKTWPSKVKVRNDRFLSVALRRQFATKRRLSAALFDNLGRGNLLLHEQGGTRRPRGAAIAIPSKANLQPRRGSHGVPKGLRPRNLPNSFVKPSKHGPVIFQRVGTYTKGAKGERGTDNRHLRVMYGLAPSTHVNADVPFHADFNRVLPRAVWRSFGPRLLAAMAGRRK